MYHVIAIDDEMKAIDRFKRLVQNESLIHSLAGFTNPADGIEYCRLNMVDIAFLDIDMPEIDGIKLAKLILRYNPDMDIVFITAHDQYALEAFQVHAYDYLLKPIGKDDIHLLLNNLDRKKNKKPAVSPLKKLQVQCFGTFYCFINRQLTEHIHWRTAKTEELFALLLRYNGVTISKEQIIDKLWPDTTPDKASNNFRVTCTYLRTNLKSNGFSDILQRERDSYFLNTNNIECDVHKFLSMIKPGIDLLGYAELEEAITLYSAPYLDGRDYEWSIKYGQWLENKLISILYRLAAKDEINQNYEAVCERMKLILLHDTFNDDAVMRFISAKLKLGDTTAAAITYQKYKEYIQRELGINPSEKLQDFVRRIND
jgi:two-component system, LytTR family, response regulator